MCTRSAKKRYQTQQEMSQSIHRTSIFKDKKQCELLGNRALRHPASKSAQHKPQLQNYQKTLSVPNLRDNSKNMQCGFCPVELSLVGKTAWVEHCRV